ncbi:MAG: N-acetyl-gamma-glutamyl-phosphate reductase [Helicobacteraceae bacterium]|jgi:N-acetyl-gamma-glutamyl-phosphate reductase|nr:N-acetyl-gamma-glutamyl-phosphate reductase [Helicobacteraceae bacterium]
MTKIPVAIVGASGYTGLELIKILLNHPRFEIAFLGASEAAGEIAKTHKSLNFVIKTEVEKTEIDEIARRAELAFLAVPHKQAARIAKELLAKGVKVVDLSADYRLTRENYEAAYGGEHEDLENLAHAIYGMSELVGVSAIQNARLVANPGCYPTASILAALPFLPFADLSQPIIIDAKSGVSGAGKSHSDRTHFVNVNENFFAYSPISHRHAPEIEEKLTIAANRETKAIFVPQLLPATRGMIASVYIRLAKQIADPNTIAREFYAANQFVRVINEPPQMKFVAGTHFADIYAMQKDGTIFVQSAIDNLLRGASSAAAANANLMCGLDLARGLPTIAYAP